MKHSEVILSAKSPSEAVAIIAALLDTHDKYIEDLEVRITELEGGATEPGWGSWDQEPDGAKDIQEELAELKERLQGNEDEHESKALRAQIFLLEDQLRVAPDIQDNSGNRTVPITDESGDVVVEVATVDEETQDQRETFARDVLKLEEVYGKEPGADYIQSYRKAGPLLVYLTDRDFVMGLSDEVKRAMVNDVERSSPDEAHEMARDIFKDADPGGPEIAVSHIVNSMG